MCSEGEQFTYCKQVFKEMHECPVCSKKHVFNFINVTLFSKNSCKSLHFPSNLCKRRSTFHLVCSSLSSSSCLLPLFVERPYVCIVSRYNWPLLKVRSPLLNFNWEASKRDLCLCVWAGHQTLCVCFWEPDWNRPFTPETLRHVGL